jgi:lipoprotein signal peptidase
MRTGISLFLVLILLTLIVDILVRIINPTPTTISLVSDVPLISSWIDIILAVEFGIPVAMEAYSVFL